MFLCSGLCGEGTWTAKGPLQIAKKLFHSKGTVLLVIFACISVIDLWALSTQNLSDWFLLRRQECRYFCALKNCFGRCASFFFHDVEEN